MKRAHISHFDTCVRQHTYPATDLALLRDEEGKALRNEDGHCPHKSEGSYTLLMDDSRGLLYLFTCRNGMLY